MQIRDRIRRTGELTPGRPRYYAPVCIRYAQGFRSGTICYREVPPSESKRGPIIVDATPVRQGSATDE